jgi:DNA-binding response OmpR family regulator
VIERQPDLILLDLMMPYLEGEDELRLLKMNETTKQIPVIVVTARHEAKQEEPRYRHDFGVIEVITKPFDMDKLVAVIKRTIG